MNVRGGWRSTGKAMSGGVESKNGGGNKGAPPFFFRLSHYFCKEAPPSAHSHFSVSQFSQTQIPLSEDSRTLSTQPRIGLRTMQGSHLEGERVTSLRTNRERSGARIDAPDRRQGEDARALTP